MFMLMRDRAVRGHVQACAWLAQLLRETQRCVVVVFRIMPTGEAPRGAGHHARLQCTGIVLGVGAKPAARQPASRYRERMALVGIVLGGDTDVRDIPADELVSVVSALEYLPSRWVLTGDHRLYRSLAEILTEPGSQGRGEFLAPVAGVTAHQPSPSAPHAAGKGRRLRLCRAVLAGNDVDHPGTPLRLVLHRWRRENLDALDVPGRNRLKVVAGL